MKNQKITDKYHFFWGGTFSQWASSPFIDEIHTDIVFSCAEQYMMYKKALLMGDNLIAKRILADGNPKNQKALGRRIKNFDVKLWDKFKFAIVVNGNILKFMQNPKMLKELKSINKKFVEASPYDKIWGIGLNVYDASSTPPEQWKGENLLGQAIDKAKQLILENEK